MSGIKKRLDVFLCISRDIKNKVKIGSFQFIAQLEPVTLDMVSPHPPVLCCRD